MKAEVRPSGAIQGLDVYLTTRGTQRVHALVVSDVLEKRFDGDSTPGGWMTAYRRNSTTIEAVILRRHQAAPGHPVVVTLADFER